MEPTLIEIEPCNRFFIVEQRWGIDETATGGGISDSIGNQTNRPGSFETAYIFQPMQGPYARVYREWVRMDNRRHLRADRPRFAYIVEARTRRQVVQAMNDRGHVAKFNSRLYWPRPWEGAIVEKRNLTISDLATSATIKRMTDHMTRQLDDTILGHLLDAAEARPIYYEESTPIYKENNVNSNDLDRQMEALRRQMADLQDKIDERNARPSEPEGDRAVIRYRVRFNAGGVVYHYAAIKCGDRWYTTARRGPNQVEWSDLLDWLDTVDWYEIDVSTGFESL